MSHGWTKYFIDGATEYGDDSLVSRGLASWSRGRLSNISSVVLYNKKDNLRLVVPNTNWHQFDRYSSIVSTSGSAITKLVFQAIQAEIQERHVGLSIYRSEDCIIKLIATSHNQDNRLITGDLVGRWLTIILGFNSQSIYFSDRGTIQNVYKRVSG